MGSLLDSFSKTRLDITDKRPSENFLILDTVTNYPSATVKYRQKRVSGFIKNGRFEQSWTPRRQYLDSNSPGSDTSGDLRLYLGYTEFDVDDSSPTGFNTNDRVTNYPPTSTGTPSTSSFIEPAKNFNQPYVGKLNTYLEENPIKGEGKLKSTLANTNLDISDEKPEGGIPYEKREDPTIYPVLTHKNSSTLGNFPIEAKAAQKFKHPFNPQNTYLDFMSSYTKTNNVPAGVSATGGSRFTGTNQRPAGANPRGAFG